MDRNLLANKLGVENLNKYIFEEISIGKREAESYVGELFSTNLKLIENINSDSIKVVRILSEILNNKTDISNLSYSFLAQMIRGNEDKSKYKLHNSSKNEEFAGLADYILDYFDFNNISNDTISSKLKGIRKESIKYHASTIYIDKCTRFFEILNDKCKLDKYTWDWSNFEEGLQKVLTKHELEKISLKSECEVEIKTIKFNKDFEIKELKSKIENLVEDIERLNYKEQFMTDFYNKYYDNTQVTVNNTYFGDILPFLFNLFNFLKKNNMLSYSWSYFYSCMIIGNNEMIPLSTTKKLNFVGRIFFHLGDYLTLQYKDESFKFLQSKFLINDNSITDNFKTNHMKPTYDRYDYPELIIIDDFFESQKKIYLKM